MLCVLWPLYYNAWFFFGDDALPVLDFASNDMLVAHARDSMLLHGHYSRLGFYHPGPFYWLFFSFIEFLTYDLFKCVASPMAAHSLAVMILAVSAIVTWHHLLFRLTGSILVASLATLLGVVLINEVAPRFVATQWPPLMVVSSAMWWVAGVTGVLALGMRWLPAAVFGGVQLIHGHAMFVILLPVMILVMVGLWWLVSPRHTLVRLMHTVSPTWMTACVVMAVLFAVPLLLNAIDGNAASIVRLLTESPPSAPNGLPLLMPFFDDVGRTLPLALSVYVVGGVIWRYRMGVLPLHYWAASVVAFAGYVALAIFMVFSLDSPSHVYLGYWFSVCPALLSVTGCCLVFQAARGMVRGVLMLFVAALVALRLPLLDIHFMPNDAHRASLVQAWSALQSLARSEGRLVVRVDSLDEPVWSDLLTLLSLEKRAGVDALCVSQDSWHISFHEWNRCDALPDGMPRWRWTAADPSVGDPVVKTSYAALYKDPQVMP